MKKIIIILILSIGSNSFGASHDLDKGTTKKQDSNFGIVQERGQAGSQRLKEQGRLYEEFGRNRFEQRKLAEEILIIKKMIADNPLVEPVLNVLHGELLTLTLKARHTAKLFSTIGIVLEDAELGWDIIDQQRLKDLQEADQRLKAKQEADQRLKDLQEADQRLKDQQIADQRLQEERNCLNDCCDKLSQCLKFLFNSTKKRE